MIFFNPAADLILGALDVVLRLQAHPERRRGAERLGEPQSRVSGERGLPIDQPLDAGARHADYAGYGIGRKLHRHEKLLAQHFTGMDSRKLLAHSVTVHDSTSSVRLQSNETRSDIDH